MLLNLRSITCRRTQGETVEEPFLRIYIDGSDDPLGFWGYMRGRSMRRGESAVINLSYEFGSDARVELWECDDPRFGAVLDYPNQHIGDILINPRLRGRYTEVLGPSLGAPTSRAYTITFDVTEDHEDTLDDYCLTLRTLRCDDAQEAGDEVYLKVDDRTVWGPENFRTDQAQSITLRPVPIKSTAMIELWEKDSSRSDFLGQFRLEITDGFDFAGIQQQRFSRDDGIVGDATYTLFYSVRPRDWVAGGC